MASLEGEGRGCRHRLAKGESVEGRDRCESRDEGEAGGPEGASLCSRKHCRGNVMRT